MVSFSISLFSAKHHFLQNLLQQVETDWTVSPPTVHTSITLCFCHTKTPTMHLERLLPTREPFFFHVNTNQRHRKSKYLQHKSECGGEEEEEGRLSLPRRRSVGDAAPVGHSALKTRYQIQLCLKLLPDLRWKETKS